MISPKTKQEIDKRLDSLVDKAQSLIESTGVYRDLEKAQIRNLLDMASSTDSVKALEVFIRYQMGRKRLPANFGDQVVEEIKHLESLAKEVSKNVDEQRQVWLELIRLYLGYANRYFVYKKGD